MIDLLSLKRKAHGHAFLKKDGPDTTGVNQAAAQSAATSADALKWYQDEYAKTEPDRAAATERANKVSDAQLEAMNFATGEAKDLSQRNKTVFQPTEDKIVADANSFDTAGRRQGASDTAVAGVQNQFGSAQDAMTRAIRRTGGSTGGRSLALMQDIGTAKAKAAAGASSAAVNNVEQQGHARMMDAAGLGRGIVGNQATMQGIASQNGMGSVQAAGAGLTSAQSGAPMMTSGYTTALNGSQISGNLYGQAAKIGAGDGGAGMMQGVGGIMQGIGSIWGNMGSSDEDLKTDIEDVPDEEALQQVTGLDNKAWRYKPGQGDEGEHEGPMAQQVRRMMGDRVAPGGQMIDLKAMGKKNAQAITALTKQLEALEAEIGQLESA